MKEFTNVAREVARKRNKRFIPIKIVPARKDEVFGVVEEVA